MKKKLIFILFIIILGVLAGWFIMNKVNINKRNYELEEILEFNYFIYKENDKFGVIDKDGKAIVSASYQKVEIPNPSKDVFICSKDGKSIAINSNNKQLFEEYNSIEAIKLKNATTNLAYEKSILKAEKNGKYGLIDFSGKKIYNTEYDSIEGLPGIEGELLVEKDNKFGVVNIKGTILVEVEYDSVSGDNYYNENNKHGFIVGQKNENGYNYGYINYRGIEMVKPEYNDISRVIDIPTEDGIYLIAAKNGQYGVIKNKKCIINNEYQSIEYDKTTETYILQKGKQYGVSNNLGKIIIPIENTNIQVKGEYLYIEKNNIKEVYDKNANKVNIEFNKTIMPTSNDNYKIVITTEENGNYYGVIDKDEKQIIKSEFLYIEYAFDNNFIACGKNGKLGVINNNGEPVIELKYDLVQKIQGKNLIQTLLSDEKTTEIYSVKMKKICEMKNATIENQDEYIKLYSDTELKYLDKDGEIVESSKILPNNKIYAANKDGKWGYIDNNGNTIVDYKYEFAGELNKSGYAAVKDNGKWGAINSDGKIVIDPKYEINESNGKVDFIGEYVKINTGFGSDYYTKDI